MLPLLLLFLCLGCATTHGVRPATGELAGPVLEVHFLDVGEGDSIYVRTPNGKHYLIDTGDRGARKLLIPYLKAHGVTHLDGVLITHGHLDHIGALYYLAAEIPISVVFFSGHMPTSAHNLKTLKRLEEKHIALRELRAGDRLDLDPDLVAMVYHPPASWDGDAEDPNNMSVVVRLTYGDIDFLLMGDAEKKSEKEIMRAAPELESEVLKVGHHGSETSTGEEFLAAVSPEYAVISCGRNNKFGHPAALTLGKLERAHATILRTDENGTIEMRTDGRHIIIRVKGKEWQPVAGILGINRGGNRWAVAFAGGGRNS